MRDTMGVRVRFHRGAWWVFIAHRGRRRAKRIGERATAQEVARKLRERLALGDLNVFGTNSGESLQSYASRWLGAGETGRKASTHRYYEFNLTHHILPALGARPVAGLRRADCRELIAQCRGAGLKRASLQGVQRTLSAVLSQAVEDELLPANPAFRMGRYLRLGDERKREINPLTREEAAMLVAKAQEHFPEFAPVILCALRTGLRLGELIGLRWSDVDFRGRFIEVHRNIVAGKVTSTKNHQRRRVDMSAQLAKTLRWLRMTRRAASLKAGQPMPPWVFANREGKPLDGDNLRQRVFYRLLERAELRQIRIHDLRHTYASLLIAQGESLAYVRDQLGHSSIQVTVDVYGHLIPGSNRAAVDRLDDATIRNPGATGATLAQAASGAK